MSLEKDLRFCFGAIARKDYRPELCHFRIEGGTATSYDGLLSMSSPIEVDMDIRPHARGLMAALRACIEDEPIALYMTGAGRLAVKSGRFRAYVPCLDIAETFAHPAPEGAHVAVTPELLTSIKRLAPLMATDASRPWAQGIRIKGNSTFVTNNIILAEYWHGSGFPHEIILPKDAVDELIRINRPPIDAQVTENSVTFHFEGGRWMRSALRDGAWPDGPMNALFERGGDPQDLPDDFFKTLLQIKPFLDDDQTVHLSKEGIRTSREDMEGATIEMPMTNGAGSWNLLQLLLLKDIATKVDWENHPRPCYFQGDKIRGFVIGKVMP